MKVKELGGERLAETGVAVKSRWSEVVRSELIPSLDSPAELRCKRVHA